MSTSSARFEHEVRPILDIPPRDQAIADDQWVRDFDRRLRDWPNLAQVCLRVDQRREWDLLGFHSYDHWLADAAPFSRSLAYWAVGTFKELGKDFTAEELADMPNGTASVMKQLSSEARRDPRIRAAAKKKPKDFRKTVKEIRPEQHIEEINSQTFNFTDSQWERISDTVEAWRSMNNPESSMEEVIEGLCSDWMNSMWEDSPYSNEQRAKQLQEAAHA